MDKSDPEMACADRLDEVYAQVQVAAKRRRREEEAERDRITAELKRCVADHKRAMRVDVERALDHMGATGDVHAFLPKNYIYEDDDLLQEVVAEYTSKKYILLADSDAGARVRLDLLSKRQKQEIEDNFWKMVYGVLIMAMICAAIPLLVHREAVVNFFTPAL